jgi:hypothetical protein
MRYPCFVTSTSSRPITETTLSNMNAAGLWPIVQFDDNRGLFQHWMHLATDAVNATPGDDTPILICQDDILCCRGLGAAISNLKWPDPSYGCLSLYCPAKYMGQGNGWVNYVGSWAWGACALLFQRKTLAAIVGSDSVSEWKSDRHLDKFLGIQLEKMGLKLVYHSPSLVQHVGGVSADGRDDPAAGWRAAGDFVGVDYVVTDLSGGSNG